MLCGSKMKAILSAAAVALLLACSCSGAVRAADGPPAPADAVEEPVRLPVTIDGKDYALDTLVVRLPGDNKLPVALITHGSSDGDPRAATIDWLRGWAHDFAHRGWLAVAVMRRGYGGSEGEAADDAGTCAMPDIGHYLDAHADDLEAALRSVARRPDADMGRVLAIGDSAGGAAVMALAGRPSVTLSAVVNVSGGFGRRLGPFRPDPACALRESDLVWNFARFGAVAHMPTLWLYAENDGWFRPGLVGRMRAAFTGSGGRAQLAMLPPFKGDGHALFFAPGGRQLLLPELDGFLRANGLPTWDEAAFAPVLAALSQQDRETVEDYLRLPTEKALALVPGGGVYWHDEGRTAVDARTAAMAYCKKQSGVDCTLAAENFRPLVPAPPEAAARPSP